MVRAFGMARRRHAVMGDMPLQKQHALTHAAQLLPPLLFRIRLHDIAPSRRSPA